MTFNDIAPYLSGGIPVGTVGTVVVLILKGKLRPQKFVDEMRADSQARIDLISEVANTWKEAYQVERASGKERESALQECLELSRTSVKILRSLREDA